MLGGDGGAAARLGMPRTTLVYRMRKLGIAREQGSKTFRSSLCGLSDSPAGFNHGRMEAPLGETERTIERAFSQVGMA